MKAHFCFCQTLLLFLGNIFKTQFNRFLDIAKRLINCLALGNTAIKSRTFYPIPATLVFMDNNRKLMNMMNGCLFHILYYTEKFLGGQTDALFFMNHSPGSRPAKNFPSAVIRRIFPIGISISLILARLFRIRPPLACRCNWPYRFHNIFPLCRTGRFFSSRSDTSSPVTTNTADISSPKNLDNHSFRRFFIRVTVILFVTNPMRFILPWILFSP